MKAIITVGISASGKTSWAIASGCHVVSRDDFRWQIMRRAGIKPSWANWKWKWENQVNEMVDSELRTCVAQKTDVVIADTNLSESIRNAMVTKLTDLGFEVEFKYFDISYDEAVKRDNERPNGVGYAVIQKQYQQYLDMKDNRVVMDESNPTAVIVDIDGTVAKMEGHRGPFEWDKVHLDSPNQPVIDMVRGLSLAGHFIIFTSGRDGSCRDLTLQWLNTHIGLGLFDQKLLMREPGDQRKDTIVKEEIFRKDIDGNFNIIAVLDDRPSVCRMWRDLGLNVIQVGNPYIEF